ncbi:MAG: inositol monophosphatase [Acidimicrobiales bacterium]|nr:inositol monophosphatase [Acidimicrobiales bacterium]
MLDPTNDSLYAELLDLAHQAATRAGDALLDGLGRARSYVATKSSRTDMVTEMDHTAERLIVETITSARPDDGIIGEEGTNRPGTSCVRWLIDPLDGTTNYLYGHPGFAVSVAAALEGEGVVVGVVVDPMHEDTFAARRGSGATRNGLSIRCSEATELAGSLVATGFSYDPDRRRQQAEVLVTLLPRVRDIRRMGAAALDLCSVACGRVDAFYEKGLQPWDFAAGALIAAEAGATVGDLDGGPASSEFTLAASPALFAPLRQLLQTAGATHA